MEPGLVLIPAVILLARRQYEIHIVSWQHIIENLTPLWQQKGARPGPEVALGTAVD